MVEEFVSSLLEKSWGPKVLATIFGFALIIALSAGVAVPIANAVRNNDLRQIDEKISTINERFLTEEEKENLKISAVCEKLDIQVDRIIERLNLLETNLTRRIDKVEEKTD